MAGIDKLRLDYYDFALFRNWVLIYHPKLLMRMYSPFEEWPGDPGEKRYVANFFHYQDRLLLWRCPYPFIRRYLEKQCGFKTKWYHKLFWTEL